MLVSDGLGNVPLTVRSAWLKLAVWFVFGLCSAGAAGHSSAAEVKVRRTRDAAVNEAHKIRDNANVSAENLCALLLKCLRALLVQAIWNHARASKKAGTMSDAEYKAAVQLYRTEQARYMQMLKVRVSLRFG